jgi:hypothetical protein
MLRVGLSKFIDAIFVFFGLRDDPITVDALMGELIYECYSSS